MQDLPPVVADDEKVVQNTKRERWDSEEIHCSNGLAMVFEEGDSWPMAFFDCPGGHRVRPETRVVKHGPDFSDCYFPSNRASQESDGHRREMVPKDGQTLSQRRSSCLWFQIVGVETYLLLPDDQRDRGNLPRQSQACHRGLPPLGQQILVEIVQRSRRGAGSHRSTLENIFEVVVVVPI